MTEAPFGLTEKEREVLRLLATGHDAKSAAAFLRLSVHTVNDRLREARRKTGAGTSRGAARLLAQWKAPEKLVPKEFGVVPSSPESQQSLSLHSGAPGGSRFMGRWGVPFMVTTSMLAVLAALWGGGGRSGASTPEAPRVIATFPASGATVPAGPITLRVTFDRPMRRQSYSFVQKSPQTFPNCGRNQPRQSADGRTFLLQCEVLPNRSYEIWFNNPPYTKFASESGVPAIPHRLAFRSR